MHAFPPVGGQAVLSAFAGYEQLPDNASHDAVRHVLLVVQAFGVPRQTPPTHTSLVVHRSLSLHCAPVNGGYTHAPVAGSHAPNEWH
jgi:hypothetical protein